MSFYSRLRLTVKGLEESEIGKVKLVLEEQGVPEVSTFSNEVYGEGDINLSGSEPEADWGDRVVGEIWKALQRPVEVEADWWYERDPDETHSYDEDRYNEMFPPLTQLAMAADEGED